MIDYTAPDLAATTKLAQTLAGQCRAGDCLLLIGELGAGKTAFARAFIQSLCGEVEVASPTFSLVQTYLARNGVTLWHGDFYRLTHEGELQEIGLDEALSHALCLIEWPQIAQKHLPKQALSITISGSESGEARVFNLAGEKTHWTERLAVVQKLLC